MRNVATVVAIFFLISEGVFLTFYVLSFLSYEYFNFKANKIAVHVKGG